jgi:PTS system nitrogen regulatory IIA component
LQEIRGENPYYRKGNGDSSVRTVGTTNILDALDKRMILPGITSRTKEGVLRGMVRALTQMENQISEDRLMDILPERERLGSTGMGEGVAIPHGKIKEVDKLLVCFGRSRSGVDFESLDGKPTHLFCLLVAPEDSSGMHLKMLARISRLRKDAAFRQRLMEALSAEEIYLIFFEAEKKTCGRITAGSSGEF